MLKDPEIKNASFEDLADLNIAMQQLFPAPVHVQPGTDSNSAAIQAMIDADREKGRRPNLDEGKNISNEPVVQDLKKKAFKLVNTSKVENLLKRELDKLSPEEKNQLLQKLPLSEVEGNNFSSFSSTIDNVLNQTVLENKMDFHDKVRKTVGGYEPGEDPTKFDKALGKVLKGVGAVNVMSMGFLPA